MKKIISFVLMFVMIGCLFTGCIDYTDSEKTLTEEETEQELNALMKNVKVTTVSDPVLDIYSDDVQEADALANISVYPLVVKGNGAINIEVAADTEMSSEAPDDWMVIIANKFNKENHTYNGKKITISVRQITGGEVVTYMRANAYKPDLYVPSHAGWGKMLDASGIHTITLCDRLLGNTAGILMSDKIYDDFINKYGEVSIKNVVEANLNGDLKFAYTNPYTSSTGLNMLTMILKAFDEENPVSQKAAEKLNAYQRTSPPTAYTTAVMRNKAAKGLIDAMVMEEQAYVFTQALSKYIYVPAGIRHDHPVFTFDYVSEEKQEAAKVFIEYCLSDESQKLGYEKGFNRHNEYVGEEPGLDGNGYLEAQSLWKQNKNGGIPTVAVFIADVSGSMNGEPLNELKKALIATAPYINSDSYIGLISYSDNVTKHLNIGKFDDKQRAYFSGEVKSLKAGGGTATYNAVLTAMQMIREFGATLPEYKPMIFLLTDGQQNQGWSLSRILPVVKGTNIPVYSIAYNYSGNKDLETLSEKNEAVVIPAKTEDLINQLRGLFNVEG